VTDTPAVLPDLYTLVSLFYSDPARLSHFESAVEDEMPSDYAGLLAHENHMTVTVERFFRSSVDVKVLETDTTPTHYARKILLSRQTDGAVVQFGIMRLKLSCLSAEVRKEVESRRTPLGRILIQHNVLREVHLVKLWKAEAGPDLATYFGVPHGTLTYGRTAMIDCNGEPGVELLEIVRPM
jgi:chorismate-pyruvate lyase